VPDTPTERDDESTWAKLRRGKVVQWGLLYVAGAWGFLQGLQYVGDTFHWPEQVRQVSVLALVIGLPIVLVVAWYHGDRGQQRVSGTELAIIALLLLLGVGIFWWYQDTSQAPATASAPDVGKTSGAPTDARPSVAVLPFENRSRLEDDAYFVDGIHDDILTQLSKLSALKVISRTSVEQFRSTNLPIKAIAQQLGVTTILEGGVQRGGDRVRVNVQLIDAASDNHLWAETYDRELTAANIFAIQSELSTAIAGALQAALTPAERKRVSAIPTKNLEAWESYQLGRQRMARRTTEALSDAEGFFQQAIDRDPNFALAYVGLADTLMLQVNYGAAELEAVIARVKTLVAKAQALDPELAEAVASSASLAQGLNDWPKAEAEFRRAIELNPNYATAHQWYAGLLQYLGRKDDALVHARRAAELDPRSAIVRNNLARVLMSRGQFADALTELAEAIEIDPSQPNAYFEIGLVNAYALGRIDHAVPWIARSVELDPGNPSAIAYLAGLYLDLGEERTAEQLVAQALRVDKGTGPPDFTASMAALYRGQSDVASKHAQDALKAMPQVTLMLAVQRNADLRANDYTSARNRYARAYPELIADPSPKVDAGNTWAAIDLALVLQRSGEDAAADKLLDLSDAALRGGTRLGEEGFGIADVQIHALRGEKTKALSALREAERAGWRGPVWRYYRDHDPELASIRDEPEFKAIFADIERDMARQRAALAARPKGAPLDLSATGT
jgi:TolB-like protein/Tfp pilus assembly protein PilF